MYQTFIGLEIHIHLLTKTKAFCACKAFFGDEPNSNVCPVCMGYPGVLPALNEEAIRMAYLVATALHCEPSTYTVFERKNYFYPDMPKNYQISQFAAPVGTNGWMDLKFGDRTKRIKIKEVHMEEDAGKMIHVSGMSLLDYNRAGVALLEIVTQPDIETGEEAEAFLQNFRRMVRYLGVCDGNMEEGSLRCDANVSINLPGKGLGTKVEIKNMNSFKFVRKALNYEVARQSEALDSGKKIIQETRLWNENRDVSESMRSKESSHDYRYFPEPDLPPFRPDEEFLRRVRESMVELPEARMERFVREYSLTPSQAEFLCDEKSVADYFEKTVRKGSDPQLAALWLASDVKKIVNREGVALEKSPLTPERFAALLVLLKQGSIHGKIAKQVLEAVFSENKDPAAVIKEKGWDKIADRDELGRFVDEVFAENDAAVSQLRGGDEKPFAFLIGQIMRKTSGRAEPGMANELVREKIKTLPS